MLNNSVKQNNHQPKPLKNKMAWLFLLLASTLQTGQAQNVTQTIIINQTSYGGTNAGFIKGNGITASEKREVSPFQGIKVEAPVTVNYHRASTVQVELTGDQNLLPIITTQVVQGLLVISSKQSYQSQQPITIALSSPHLESGILQGSGSIYLTGLSEKSLQLDLQGSGNITVEGNVEHFSVQAKGSGKVNAKDLESIQAELQVTGSGNIISTVKESLNASIVGSGNITYFGHPNVVNPNIVGSGNIIPAD